MFREKKWRQYKELIMNAEKVKGERYARFAEKMLQAANVSEEVFGQSLQLVPFEELHAKQERAILKAHSDWHRA